MLALDEKGFRIMLLLRLSPIMPFNIVNYAAGTSSMSFTSYTLALLGLLPGTILFVFIGGSAGAITDMNANGIDPAQVSGIASGVLFGMLAMLLTTYYTRMELKKITERRSSEIATRQALEISQTLDCPNQVVSR